MDANGFDAATQKELATFLEQEQAKAKLNAEIHSHTEMCWDKCLPGTGSNARFTKSEGECLVNCVGRFLDCSSYIVKELQKKQQGH